MCNCQPILTKNKENGTMVAGSHKRRKKKLTKKYLAIFATLVLNTCQKYFLYLKVAKKKYKKFIIQRLEILLFHITFQTEMTSKLFLDPLVLLFPT